jgi:hypothetical protein
MYEPHVSHTLTLYTNNLRLQPICHSHSQPSNCGSSTVDCLLDILPLASDQQDCGTHRGVLPPRVVLTNWRCCKRLFRTRYCHTYLVRSGEGIQATIHVVCALDYTTLGLRVDPYGARSSHLPRALFCSCCGMGKLSLFCTQCLKSYN